MRKLFNLYNDWLSQWGFPDGRGLVKRDYLISFEEDLSFMIIRGIYKNNMLSFAYVREVS